LTHIRIVSEQAEVPNRPKIVCIHSNETMPTDTIPWAWPSY
jgi:hypothetical protein